MIWDHARYRNFELRIHIERTIGLSVMSQISSRHSKDSGRAEKGILWAFIGCLSPGFRKNNESLFVQLASPKQLSLSWVVRRALQN